MRRASVLSLSFLSALGACGGLLPFGEDDASNEEPARVADGSAVDEDARIADGAFAPSDAITEEAAAPDAACVEANATCQQPAECCDGLACIASRCCINEGPTSSVSSCCGNATTFCSQGICCKPVF